MSVERFRTAQLCLYVTCLAACAAPADEPAPRTAVVQPPTHEVDTSAGRWRVPGPRQSPLRSQSPVEAASLPPTLPPNLQPMLIAPVVRNSTDLSRLLVPGNLSTGFLADHMLQYFQVVTGVPTRYGGERFKPVRDAFTPACETSAGGYQTLSVALMRSQQFSFDIASGQVRDTSNNYERDCLTPLSQVPAPIRAVTGVLVNAFHVPWCSATIGGPQKIITSRHCFVDPGTGAAMPEHVQVGEHSIAFISVTPHDGINAFSVRWPGGIAAPLSAFPVGSDYQLLEVGGGTFTSQAKLGSSALVDAAMPLPAWVVGSNANLGDLNHTRSALDFTRGSSPKACAILEVSRNGCLYHVCQTGNATSGSGVLVLDPAGGVTLVGVHKGTIAEATGCEPQPPFSERLNLAIPITNNNIGP